MSSEKKDPKKLKYDPAAVVLKAAEAAPQAELPLPKPPRRKTNNPKSICFAFNREGGCVRGDECKFLHEKGDVPSEEEIAIKRAEKIAAKSVDKAERQAAHLEREAMRAETEAVRPAKSTGFWQVRRAKSRQMRLAAFKEREATKRLMMAHVDAALLDAMDADFDRALVTFNAAGPVGARDLVFENTGNLDVHLNADTGTVVFETMPRERLSEMLCLGALVVLTVRTFSRTMTVPGEKCCCHEHDLPLKRIYGFVRVAGAGKKGFSRLSQVDNQEAQCTDSLTGAPLKPEAGVEYC